MSQEPVAEEAGPITQLKAAIESFTKSTTGNPRFAGARKEAASLVAELGHLPAHLDQVTPAAEPTKKPTSFGDLAKRIHADHADADNGAGASKSASSTNAAPSGASGGGAA